MKKAVWILSVLLVMVTAVTSCLPPPPGFGGNYGGRSQRNYGGYHHGGYGGHYGYSHGNRGYHY